MQRYFIYWCLFIPFVSLGQKETLYYFTGKDTMTVGVKTSGGSIILPPAFYSFYYKGGDKVEDREIFLCDTNRYANDLMNYDYRMKVYDRNGKFLYCPFWFDNGPDYYKEGLRRFVENGKMGFVAPSGKKVIPAKYNFVDPFYRGYAVVCLDCIYMHLSDDEEHCCGYAGSKYAIIDRRGTIVYNSKLDIMLNDSLLVALKLIHSYTQKEKSLIQALEKSQVYMEFVKKNQSMSSGDIVVWPRNEKCFYMVTFRELDYAYGDDLTFLITSDSKSIFFLDEHGDKRNLTQIDKK